MSHSIMRNRTFSFQTIFKVQKSATVISCSLTCSCARNLEQAILEKA